MSEIVQYLNFETREQAEAASELFLARYGGVWNPYDGATQISPPNDDRPTWQLRTSRRNNAD